MKKILFVSVAITIAALLLITPARQIKADELAEQPEIVEVVEQEQEEELTIEEYKQEVEIWLKQYFEESQVAKLITWAVDAGVLSALFAVVVKYRKYKATSVEDMIKQFKAEIGEHLKGNFKDLSDVEINRLQDAITNLEKSNETIMKVLVLMQDSTTKGKQALVEYLGSKTQEKEIKQATNEVAEKLEAEQQKAKEVNDKVAGEYENIF